MRAPETHQEQGDGPASRNEVIYVLFSALQVFFPRLAFREWCWASPAGDARQALGARFF